MRRALLVISILFCIKITYATSLDRLNKYLTQKEYLQIIHLHKETESKQEIITEELCAATLYSCIKLGDYQYGRSVYTTIKSYAGRYLGYFDNPFTYFLSVCINQLDLPIYEEDIDRYVEMRTSSDSNNKTKAKILEETAYSLCKYNIYELGLKYYNQYLTYEKYLEPIYFYRNLINIGKAFNQNQMPQKALITYKKCAEYYKNKYGQYSKNYAKLLNEMAYISPFLNIDYINLLMESKGIYEHNADTTSDLYAITLDNIATYYTQIRDTEKALSYSYKANQIFKSIDSTNTDYAKSLNNIGAILAFDKDTDSSISEKYYLKALSINPTVSAAMNLALLYDYQKKYDQAEVYYDMIGHYNKHNVYANQVANHYALKGDFNLYSAYMAEYLNYLRQTNQQNVIYMTEEERKRYINIIQNVRLQNLFTYAADNKHEQLGSLCFDYLLMSKSLLLSYDSSIDEIINPQTHQS